MRTPRVTGQRPAVTDLRAPKAPGRAGEPRTSGLEPDGRGYLPASAPRASGAPKALVLRLQAARAREAELDGLRDVLADGRAAPRARAEAGVRLAGFLAHRDPRPDAAEAALNEALRLAPELAEGRDATLARATVQLARGDLGGAQASLHRLAADGADPEVGLLRAEAKRQASDPRGALAALDGVRIPAGRPDLAARAAFLRAYASFAANRPADAVAAARGAFALGVGEAADTRIASKAAQLLRELTCPDFARPDRAEIEAGLKRASDAFGRGDHDLAQIEAQAVLRLEPDEALAYHVFAVAEQRRVDDRPLIGPLATAEARAALVDQLDAVLGEAGLRPAQLFGGWADLTELQRAKVAHSALLYGDLLPEMVGQRRIHLVPPGESCTAYDPDTDRAARHDAFGRHWYGTRGWVGRRDVVVGVEDVETAARGGYDTVTHELAHLAQTALQRRGLMGAKPRTRIALMSQGLGPDQVRSFEEALHRRYAAARDQIVARPVTDYAGTCLEEYFAESMMAAANPTDGPGPTRTRLEARDPPMAALCAAIFADVSRLP